MSSLTDLTISRSQQERRIAAKHRVSLINLMHKSDEELRRLVAQQQLTCKANDLTRSQARTSDNATANKQEGRVNLTSKQSDGRNSLKVPEMQRFRKDPLDTQSERMSTSLSRHKSQSSSKNDSVENLYIDNTDSEQTATDRQTKVELVNVGTERKRRRLNQRSISETRMDNDEMSPEVDEKLPTEKLKVEKKCRIS